MQWRPARILTITGLLTGCAPQPTLSIKPSVLSQDWSARTAPATSERLSLGRLLGAPDLERLITAAASRNTDIETAIARFDQAKALLRIARGSALPLVSGGASVSGSRSNLAPALDFNGSVLSIDVTLSPDLFGRDSAKRRAARARTNASFQDLQAARLQVAVEIARAYVQRATLARRLELVDTSLVTASELDRVIRVRNQEGAASRVEVGLQSIRLKQLQAERSRISEALDQTRTALAYLVGDEAPGFDVAAADLTAFTTPAIDVPSPSRVIEGRPDIQAAESRIRAANGDVDAARRAFYPSLNLSIGGALKAGPGAPLALLSDIGTNIFAAIFGRNRLNGELEFASAQQREVVSTYRATLLNALREVEDAISAIRHSDEREQLLAEVEQDARLTEKLARQQYLEGAEDLQHLLDAQDLLVSVQDARALAKQERIEGLIRLYAATGSSVQAS